MKKIFVVMGTRPEGIKLAPIIKYLDKSKDFLVKVINTGQHKKMLDQVLDIFNIKEDYKLKIMKKNQSLSVLSSRLIQSFDKLLLKDRPDFIFVQGDTTTAFIAGLIGFYHKIKIVHIEAGLRTNNKFSPFPEEINRKILSSVSDIHFAPTNDAKQNLLNENIPDKNIFIVGNTIVDALYYILKNTTSKYEEKWKTLAKTNKIIIVTTHRRENYGQGFLNIFNALKRIANFDKSVKIIYPVHLNPNVYNIAHDILKNNKNILLLKPLDYKDFVHLMKYAYLVLTDSGGIQEEAPALGKPVLVLRDTTERMESINAGVAKLVGTNKNLIYKNVIKLLEDKKNYKKMSNVKSLYGNGNTSIFIINKLKSLINKKGIF